MIINIRAKLDLLNSGTNGTHELTMKKIMRHYKELRRIVIIIKVLTVIRSNYWVLTGTENHTLCTPPAWGVCSLERCEPRLPGATPLCWCWHLAPGTPRIRLPFRLATNPSPGPTWPLTTRYSHTCTLAERERRLVLYQRKHCKILTYIFV